MEVLGSRILLRLSEPERSRRFYRDMLGLAVYREFGHPDDPGLVFFLGGGFLEVSGRSTHASGSGLGVDGGMMTGAIQKSLQNIKQLIESEVH